MGKTGFKKRRETYPVGSGISVARIPVSMTVVLVKVVVEVPSVNVLVTTLVKVEVEIVDRVTVLVRGLEVTAERKGVAVSLMLRLRKRASVTSSSGSSG